MTHRLLSYNVRYELNSPGDHAWDRRQDAVTEAVDRLAPDAVAFQEVWKAQFGDLQALLPTYEWVAPSDGEEHTVIAYDPDRYTLLEAGSQWLSEPGTEPGVPGWDSTFQKRFTYARLRDEQPFWLFDIHLPHTGEVAPRESMAMVRETLTAVSGEDPAVVAGDLNTAPGDPVYELGRASREEFRELSYASEHAETRGPADTFTGYPEGDEEPCNIDHFLVTPGAPVEHVETVVPATETEQFRPSDHRPVLVDVVLQSGESL